MLISSMAISMLKHMIESGGQYSIFTMGNVRRPFLIYLVRSKLNNFEKHYKKILSLNICGTIVNILKPTRLQSTPKLLCVK